MDQREMVQARVNRVPLVGLIGKTPILELGINRAQIRH